MDRLTEKQALIAFGANLPESGRPPQETIRRALTEISQAGHEVEICSHMFETPCFPAGAGPDYVNAVARVNLVKTDDPRALLSLLHRIEADFGRRRLQRWGMRTLDLDLLAVGDSVLPDASIWQSWAGLPLDRQADIAPEQLILPHPRIQDRAFVLVPLHEIMPNWRHPVLQRTTEELLAALPGQDRAAVRPLPA